MKVIAFDTFGTIFNMDGVRREEIGQYVQQVKSSGEWAPLELPESWQSIPAHPDARHGIDRLRRDYTVVTCSNGPLWLLAKLSKLAGISWDAIIPLETREVYKPNPEAYKLVAELTHVPLSEIMMVTANPTFGDVETAIALGMTPQVIRHPGTPEDTIVLAETLYENRRDAT